MTYSGFERKLNKAVCNMLNGHRQFNMYNMITDFGHMLEYDVINIFFRFYPRRRRRRGRAPIAVAQVWGKPTLFALSPLGAAIVTNLVLKPHAEAYCFGLSYSIVAKALIC